MTITTNGDQVPDFGVEIALRQPIPFKIHGELFHGAPEQPAGILFDMASLMNSQKDIGQQYEMLDKFMGLLLLPESYERLKARMRDPERPVTVQVLLAVMRYLIEQMTGRPTEQSSSSSAGQSSTGTTSTATSPSTGSIPGV